MTGYGNTIGHRNCVLLSICVSAGFWSLAGESESHVSGHWVPESTETSKWVNGPMQLLRENLMEFQFSRSPTREFMQNGI